MLDLEGVEKDKKRTTVLTEVASMMGDAKARYNLGNVEIREGNIDRALTRNMIAVGREQDDYLKLIHELHSHG